MAQGQIIKKVGKDHPSAKAKNKKKMMGTNKAITKRKAAPEKKKVKTLHQKCSKDFEREHMSALHLTVQSKAEASNMNLKVLKRAHQPHPKAKKKNNNK
eukprot:CAMPEP_0201522476 /NCGR_PEP_ID=MMETSP0161_2-20130828/17616_1 /ASSEMBLY_ACC=CAM_ASM_000251 /TAXON_ID=180227 /ORGANISM="Neoparamoeba aestuarina, Strain SoJaBio B1-5/56/2" /LENGTH=98 /DNA_ID=CAMNT_0047921329 /DNA_START=43 /DNA_END=339 /DNA_ORIENTATION=+